jgi:hypothetical protein
MTVDEAYDNWVNNKSGIDFDEWLYDVSGGDWDDLVEAIRGAFEAGWNARYQSLTTRDI